MLPYHPVFRYRHFILAAFLVAALAVALTAPGSDRTEARTDAVAICVAAAVCYAATRAILWIAARLLRDKWPQAVPTAALACFYAALPLFLVGLYVGSWATQAPVPSAATVAFVVAAGVSVAAAALASVRTG